MVKVLDFERGDVTVKLLHYLQDLRTRGSLIKHDKIMELLKECIQEKKSYIEAVGGIQKMPKIILKSQCKDSSKYSNQWKNYDYLPAYYSKETHSINICTDRIRHEKKLQENFIRELYVGTLPDTFNLSPDENLAKACYNGCLESLKYYTNDQKSLDAMTKTCTKYLFRVASCSRSTDTRTDGI